MRASLLMLLWLGLGCVPEVPPGEPPCTVSVTELDFGEVGFGGANAQVVVTNNAVPRSVTVEPMALPFAMGQVGQVFLSARSVTSFFILFAPSDALLHLDTFRLRQSPAGPEACNLNVPVRGLGSGSVIPSVTSLEFGSLNPGEEKTLELTLANTRRTGAAVKLIVDPPNSTFSVTTPHTVGLAERGSTVVQIKALAGAPGRATASLQIELVGSGSFISVPLQLMSGIPVAEIAPVIDLPRVGFSYGSTPKSFAERAIRVRNVGTSGSVISESALRLDRDPLSGQPFSIVETPDGGTSDEVHVTVSPQLFDGLRTGESAEVFVRLEPKALGLREFRFVLRTNDPVQPVHVVTLRTVVEELRRCSLLRVEPPSPLVLSSRPDGGLSGAVSFTNTGIDTCIIDDLRLTGTNPQYSIVEGGAAQLELPAGVSHLVKIAGPRVVNLGFVGTLRFHVFNPDSDVETRDVYAPP